MIQIKLQKLTNTLRQEGYSDLYIVSALKEYLQSYVLNFIYSESDYGDTFIFTGGTCLKKVFNINRLSEDLDFDLVDDVNIGEFTKQLENYFKQNYAYDSLNISVKQKGRQILLKFPILAFLGIAKNKAESNLLYIKIDVSPMTSTNYSLKTKLLTDFDFNYIVKYYDIETLFSNKLLAILNRQRFGGEDDREVVKGRDYFDLLWFLDKKIEPNIDRLRDLLDESVTKVVLIKKVDEKVKLATTKFKEDFKRDLQPFISNRGVIKDYVDSFYANYMDSSAYLRG